MFDVGRLRKLASIFSIARSTSHKEIERENWDGFEKFR